MIDPTDLKYQVSDEFKPDKASTWLIPIEKDGLVLAHDSIRSEMKMIRDAFEVIESRGEGLKEWEIRALVPPTEGHIEHVHAHHTSEDELVVPALKKRFKYPEKVSGRLV